MHPAPAGLGEPVLVYRPQAGRQLADGSEQTAESLQAPAANGQQPTANGQPLSTTDGSSSNQKSAINNQQSSISPSSPSTANRQSPGEDPSSIQNPLPSSHPESNIQNPKSSTTTPLPDVVTKAMPILRCSNGTAARVDESDGTTVHLAFFEWDLTDSTNVLEAFKHLPDECMGSIGMTLIAKAPPRSYVVTGGEKEGRGQNENQKSKIKNPQSEIDPLSPSGETLWFDHTVFRDPSGTTVHAFKGTWVSGASSLTGNTFRGGADQWRQIRWKSALHRFHPAYARVAQGAVRGIPNPDLAWETFQSAMLADLKMER